MTTFEKVRAAIWLETGETITPDTRLVTLVTDSLEMASLIQALEDGLGKEIPDCEAQNLFSVQDIVNYSEEH
jgi:acyl carrier protein